MPQTSQALVDLDHSAVLWEEAAWSLASGCPAAQSRPREMDISMRAPSLPAFPAESRPSPPATWDPARSRRRLLLSCSTD